MNEIIKKPNVMWRPKMSGWQYSIALDIKRMARKGSISSSFGPYFPYFPSDFTFQNVKKTRLLHLQVTVTSPNDIRLPKNMWLYLFNNRGWEEFASQHAPFSSLVTIFYFSLIALRISISTLTAGYLIIASDDNIGVSDVAIDRFLGIQRFGWFPCST